MPLLFACCTNRFSHDVAHIRIWSQYIPNDLSLSCNVKPQNLGPMLSHYDMVVISLDTLIIPISIPDILICRHLIRPIGL